MSEPHHFVFNELQKVIQKCVPLDPLIPHLRRAGLVAEKNLHLLRGKNGMKRLTSQLRNRDFDSFLKFVECILRAGSENPKINLSIVESIHHAVANFDERNGTSHASLIFHLKEQCVTESAVGESLEKVVVDDESNEDDKRQAPDDPPLELPLVGAPLDIRMPNLPYVGPIREHTFDSTGGTFYDFLSDLSIEVPSLAISEGNSVSIKVGVCCRGPFLLPENTFVITSFFCIVASGKFSLPVKVTMQHCMELTEYKRTPEIMVLRSDLFPAMDSEEFIFSPINTYPAISASWPHLSFEVNEFCVLCSVYKPHSSQQLQRQSSSTESPEKLARHLTRQVAIVDTSSPSSSMDDGDTGLSSSPQHYISHQYSSGSECPPNSSFEENTFTSSTEGMSSRMTRKSRRKRPYHTQSERREKRRSRVRYMLLLFEPESNTAPVSFYLFACQDCSASIEACKEQLNEKVKWKSKPSYRPYSFGPEGKIQVDVKVSTEGWKVVYKTTPQIRESDIQIHHLPLEERRRHVKLGLYPPQIVVELRTECMNAPDLQCQADIIGTDNEDHEFFSLSAVSHHSGMMPYGMYPFATTYPHGTGNHPAVPQFMHHVAYAYPWAQQQVLPNFSSTMPIGVPPQEIPYGPNSPATAGYYGKQLSSESRGSTDHSISVDYGKQLSSESRGSTDHSISVDYGKQLSSESRGSTDHSISVDYGKQPSCESRGSIEHSTSVEEKESLEKHVTRKAAVKLSCRVRSWKRLGVFLKLDEVELSHLCANYEAEGIQELIYQVILRWMKTNDSEPTFEKLEEALQKAEEHAALQFLWDNLVSLTLEDD